MKQPIILCKTEPQLSNSVVDVMWYKEYAIAELEENEKDDLVAKYGCREIYGFRTTWLSLRRRVDISTTTAKHLPHEWDIMDFSDSQDKAAIFGDTEFRQAKSLHPLFDDVVARLNLMEQLRKELLEITELIIPCKFSRRNKLTEKYEDEYISALKAKKLYKKSLANEVDPHIIEQIRKPFVDKFNTEYQRQENRLEEIKQQLDELKLA
jgi:hypothetical protein